MEFETKTEDGVLMVRAKTRTQVGQWVRPAPPEAQDARISVLAPGVARLTYTCLGTAVAHTMVMVGETATVLPASRVSEA